MNLPSVLWIFFWISLVIGFTPEVSSIIHDKSSSSLLYFDDSSNVINVNQGSVFFSKNDGKEWNKVEQLPDSITGFWSDPIDRKRAFAISQNDTHYITNDSGENWSTIKFDVNATDEISFITNYANSQLILVNTIDCQGYNFDCLRKVFYTDDGFKTEPKELKMDHLQSCTFTKTNKNFSLGDDNSILCIVATAKMDFIGSSVIYQSSDWLKTSKIIDDENHILSSQFISDIQIVESFIIIPIKIDRFDLNSPTEIFISKDGLNFNKAVFKNLNFKNNYKILPSTFDSLNIAIFDFNFNLVEIYRSDSTGLQFTHWTSSVISRFTNDYAIDKIQNIDGVWINNEYTSDEKMSLKHSSNTKISIDDGETWNFLKVKDEDCSNDEKCSLHLLSIRERDGEGKLITGPTPGILMGIGVIGLPFRDFLFTDLQTFISRNGGIDWQKAIDKPCAFAFGDQGNIIVAFPYENSSEDINYIHPLKTNTMYYSLDQGDSWEILKLDHEIYPRTITTTIDGSSKKFILVGFLNDDKNEIIYSIDFNGAHNGQTCKDDDFEDWYARSLDGKIGGCLYGNREKFGRRKQNANCFVNKLFDDVKTIEEKCECSQIDYECSLGFIKDLQGSCKSDPKIIANNFCRDSKTKKISLPILQKRPGSTCKDGLTLDDKKEEFDCREIIEQAKTSNIWTKKQSFDGSITQYYYLKESTNTSLSDDTLFLRTSKSDIYYSFDGGDSFNKFDSLEDSNDKFIAIYLNPFFADQIYLVTSNSKIYVSHDRGKNFITYHLPSHFNEFGLKFLTFNKRDPLKFIWYGEKNCENFFDRNCESFAYHTIDGGNSFAPLLENVRSCSYVGSIFNNERYPIDENQIFCEQKIGNSNQLSLISSDDNFKNNKEILFESIVGFAVTGEFVVVASVNFEEKSLEAFVTVDGKHFAEALFPPDFHVDRQQAYTIVDSSTKALFFHVTTNSVKHGEFGTLLKSNSNGTLYVKSIDYINRNTYGYVDYEKVEGLEGVSLVNIVNNPNDVITKKSAKKLKSMITYNDGGKWDYILPPLVDSNNNKYSCSGSSLEKCSLNLHGYTQRADIRDTYSSGSAIGMLIGVGNVGESLLPFDDKGTSTFLTTDGGVSWKEIKKGNYMWEYGDQGTILVLAPNDGKHSNTISYSLNMGNDWEDFKFLDEPVAILDLATVPSDTSRKFLLFVRNNENILETITLDFTNVHERQCKLNFDEISHDGDFVYWTPKHPSSDDNCLFGHEAMYLRRSPHSTDCFIGAAPLNKGYKKIRDCVCTRNDYECDYNYVRASDGTCKLVEGLSPPDAKSICSLNANTTEYWEPTGYRKIPLSTCKNGKELDKWVSHPCPGKESEFKERYSIKGFALFIVIFVPILVFIVATWFIYDRGIRRNGGFSRFGEIRLDEDDFHPIENNKTDKVVNDIVRGIILAIGAAITFRSIVLTRIRELFTRRNRYEGLLGTNHDGILDDDSLFNFNDIDNDDDATEIDSFIQQNDDDFNTVAAGNEYTDDVGNKSDSENDLGTQ